VEDWGNYANRPNVKPADADALNRIIAATPNSLLDVAVPVVARPCSIKRDDAKVNNVFTIGTMADYARISGAEYKEGRLFNDTEANAGRQVVVLGYDVAELSRRIADELGTSSLQPVVLVGVGNLGLALLSYRGFEKEGFEIVAAFDIEPNRKRDKALKQSVLGLESLPEFVRSHQVKMAILAVPAEAAQEVANMLVDCGIMGVLNFSPIVLHVPEEVMVNNVNLAIELENLSYFIQE